METEFTSEDLEYMESGWLDETDLLYIQKYHAYELHQNRRKNEFLLTLQSIRNKTRACVAVYVQKDREPLELLADSPSRKDFIRNRYDDWYFITWVKSIPIPCKSCVPSVFSWSYTG